MVAVDAQRGLSQSVCVLYPVTLFVFNEDCVAIVLLAVVVSRLWLVALVVVVGWWWWWMRNVDCPRAFALLPVKKFVFYEPRTAW